MNRRLTSIGAAACAALGCVYLLAALHFYGQWQELHTFLGAFAQAADHGLAFRVELALAWSGGGAAAGLGTAAYLFNDAARMPA